MTAATRAAFETFLTGRATGRPAWLPIVDTLAARIAGTDYRTLSGDAGLWTSGLLQAADLLGADAVIAGFDWVLAAEACGAPVQWAATLPALDTTATTPLPVAPATTGRQGAAVETVRRLVAMARGRLGIVAALVGPLTLAAQLRPGSPPEESLRLTRHLHAAVAEQMLKARPDLVLLCERLAELPAAQPRTWQRAYTTLRNLAGYYNVPVALYAEGLGSAPLPDPGPLRLDACLIGAAGPQPVLPAACELCAAIPAVGVPLSAAQVAAEPELVRAVMDARRRGCNLGLTTPGAIAPDTDLGALRALAPMLRESAA